MKKVKLTGTQQVQAFLAELEHPLKQEILEVRQLVLAANPQLTEHIKWNAPSFCLQGEDRITFNLAAKGFFRLVFHGGAKPSVQVGEARLFEDTSGLLEWLAPDRAMVRFSSLEDVQAKQAALQQVVNTWLYEMK
ncbi:MAG: DUF1801 domain-containing protein [Adhaeribacter sp.]